MQDGWGFSAEQRVDAVARVACATCGREPGQWCVRRHPVRMLPHSYVHLVRLLEAHVGEV